MEAGSSLISIDALVIGATLNQLLIYLDHVGAIYEHQMITEWPHFGFLQ